MKSIVQWAIRNSPAMNTFVIAGLIVGAISLIIMRREVFPSFELEIVVVQVPFPGATPEEVEEGICQKVEAAVTNIDGVKKVTSQASENFGFVIIELQGYVKDVQKVLNDIRSQVDQISTFPPRAEDPKVQQIIFRAPAITLGLLGPERSDDPNERLEQERQLRQLAETIRDDLLDLRAVPPTDPMRRMLASLFQPSGPAVTAAELVAAKPYEIAVEVPEDTLREHGISLTQLANIIRFQNIEVPGGKMETEGEEVLLRGQNKRRDGETIAEIPVLTRPNGDVVTVGDLGLVVDGFEESVSEHTINNRAGLAIRVSKTDQEDLFTIVDTVKNYVANKKLPTGYELKTWGDVSVDVKDRLRLLTSNGIQGLILVFLTLAIFLEMRLAFWVAFGIPVSMLGAAFVLLAFGQTLNMLTMFAFLMALGIVVDDAIVIGENIYEKRQSGMGFIQAAIEGTIEVVPSVISSVMTTVIAFVPLMYVTGVMGKFISVMPLAIIAMLLISLAESILVLPAHLAHEKNLFYRVIASSLYILRPVLILFRWANQIATYLLEGFIDRIYQPLLYWSLCHKRIVLGIVFGIFIGAIGLIVAGVAPLAFFPKMDGREISATIAFPNGTSAESSEEATRILERAIIKINDEIAKETGGENSVINIYRRIGEVGNANMGPTGITNGSHVATVEVQLTSPESRTVSSMDLIARWRKEVPKIAGAEVLKFGSQGMGPGGGGIEFRLLASDDSIEYLDEATERFKVYLASKKGVSDIEDNAREGKWEMVLRLNELGKTLGLDENALATTIRAAYFGEEVMRMQRGRNEVKLMVRYPRESRRSMEEFDDIRIRDTNGVERPIAEVAEVEFRRSFSTINRVNQRRCITISADVDSKEANAREIIAEMQKDFIPKVLAEFENKFGANLGVDWEGEQADTTESINSMFVGFAIALLCMFVLLTLEFRSYAQPLIIMSIIPFGLIGAVLGHAILRLDLTLFSFFGLIALTGVIVNDSIVLVDFINHRIRAGVPLFDAVMSAGKRRFRPILLTSLTTIAGLAPMLLETSLQAQVLIPMAASLIFGLGTGTALILILVPVFYSIYGTVLGWFGKPLYEADEEEISHVAQEPLSVTT